jgi:acid phosphatase
VLGDWGREGKDSQTVVAQSMAKQADKDHCDFVISTGDNFYEKGVSSVTDSQFKTSFENIYSASSLQIPWYVSLGNHDYLTNADIQVEYSKYSNRWKMPARYFAVEQKIDATTTALFLIIDTSPFITKYQENDEKYHVKSQSVSRQLAWIDSVLSHSKAQWKFAAGHHPIYSAAGTHGDTPELISQVLPIFKKYHVQAYFCGHDHNLQHLVNDGLHTYLSGGGSRSREDVTPRTDMLFGAASTGFLEVSLEAKKLEGTFYDARGNTLNTSTAAR